MGLWVRVRVRVRAMGVGRMGDWVRGSQDSAVGDECCTCCGGDSG